MWDPTRKRYLRQIDQQLKDLESRIGGLRARKRSLKGPARDRLCGNVRMLDGKLHEARRLWRNISPPDHEWPKGKKELDNKVIRLQKSITYISNTMS
jgi:hypothetical protein